MNIKKLLIRAMVSVLIFGSAVAPVLAAAPWNVTGNYEVTFFLDPDVSVTSCVHHVALSQNGTSVIGSGGLPTTGSDVYHWDITSGTQTGDSLSLTALYDLGATGTLKNCARKK